MSTRVKVLAGVVAVLLAAGGAGLWWYLGDDPPDEVDLADAVAAVEQAPPDDREPAHETTPPGDSPDPTAPPDGVAGTWTVQSGAEDFDRDDPTGTFVGFRIQEELTVGATTAVGRTGDVAGSVSIEGTTLTEATVEVDLTTITTDREMRDARVQSALDTARFPVATFTLTEPIELGDGAATGGPVTVTARGDLTLHGVTRPVEVPLEAQLVDDTIVVVGSVEITFADYDVAVPSAPIVVSVEDHGTLELQLLLAR